MNPRSASQGPNCVSSVDPRVRVVSVSSGPAVPATLCCPLFLWHGGGSRFRNRIHARPFPAVLALLVESNWRTSRGQQCLSEETSQGGRRPWFVSVDDTEWCNLISRIAAPRYRARRLLCRLLWLTGYDYDIMLGPGTGQLAAACGVRG